jgi:hypothetical protein
MIYHGSLWFTTATYCEQMYIPQNHITLADLWTCQNNQTMTMINRPNNIRLHQWVVQKIVYGPLSMRSVARLKIYRCGDRVPDLPNPYAYDQYPATDHG